MRKFIKNQLLDITNTLYKAHEKIKSIIDTCATESAIDLLAECQNTAVAIGSIIDNSEGEGLPVIHVLEEYCETVYQISTGIHSELTGAKANKKLDTALIKIENSIKTDIPVQLEIVFMPYKASMWDSLESIWETANNDPECKAYVVPIPYYDRNPDHSFGVKHYEGNCFPGYVPITNYKTFDLEAIKPDAIFIHNPYDANNYVTSVDPQYYSFELKKHTDMLVYCPYYFFDKVYSEDFIIAPGAINSDKVIVQSKKIRDLYINVYTRELNIPEHIIKNKIVSLGSPKIDAVINAGKKDNPISENWTRIIGSRKVILYNTSLNALLRNSEKYLEKIIKTLDYFEMHEDVVLWWRPHPLFESTIIGMMPGLWNTYEQIKKRFITKSTGIYDDTSDSTRAVVNADEYYGDRRSTLSYSFVFTGKPVVFTDIDEIVTAGDYEFDRVNNSMSEEERNNLFENENTDGTAGEKIYQYIKALIH